MDETGLFYKKMPNLSYVTCCEMKSGKLYLKLLHCKKGLTAKDSAARPEAFKLIRQPDGKWVWYSNQSNAWMDRDQCQKWFN
eukprot:422210-Rhodomonas_salina.1